MSHDPSLESVDVNLTPSDRFGQFLASEGKRLTKQRRMIVEQVFSHHDHFDADELMEHLQPIIGHRRLSRPTIYRTLGELTASGMLRVMSLGGRNIYEHQYGYPNHDHLYCEKCHKLIEFHNPDLEQIGADEARRHRFQVTGHRMMVIGICAECRG